MKIEIKEGDDFIFIYFIMDNEDKVEKFLRDSTIVVKMEKPVILFGFSPNWFSDFFWEWFSGCRLVAVYDNRLKEAEVIISKDERYSVGDIIKFN